MCRMIDELLIMSVGLIGGLTCVLALIALGPLGALLALVGTVRMITYSYRLLGVPYYVDTF